MALPGGLAGGFDAGGQRRNRLDYGQDLRAQIEADRSASFEEILQLQITNLFPTLLPWRGLGSRLSKREVANMAVQRNTDSFTPRASLQRTAMARSMDPFDTVFATPRSTTTGTGRGRMMRGRPCRMSTCLDRSLHRGRDSRMLPPLVFHPLEIADGLRQGKGPSLLTARRGVGAWAVEAAAVWLRGAEEEGMDPPASRERCGRERRTRCPSRCRRC